jgi:predicted Zn-dependent protease
LRVLLLAAVATACLAALAPPVRADVLPDMGSSAAELLTPQQEHDYGAYTLYELRRMGLLLEDPLVGDWLDGLGHRIAAASDRPEQDYTFFLMRDRDINAFATLGGFVGANAGMVLAAESEDEVAGVIAHEVSHVTQRHVLRAVERAKKDQLPILLATLGMIVAASGSHSSDSTNAMNAAVIGGQALAAQRRIDYTRENEAEADRIGIQTLARAGYDPSGMADFFERMQRLGRGNSGGYNAPDYLQSHPVTTLRLSEARDRAARLKADGPMPTASNVPATSSPLLLPSYVMTGGAGATPVRMFAWARERLRVLSAESPDASLREYDALARSRDGRLDPAERYGRAIAMLRVGHPAAAEAELQALAKAEPANLWLALALAEAAHGARKDELARARFDALLAAYPHHRAVSLTYADALVEMDTADAGRRAQAVLRPLLADGAEDALLQKSFARASELAGDPARAREAYAEAAYLNGRAEDALSQLTELLKRDDLDYVQRARIEARIAAITPVALELRRQGLKPEDQDGDT